MQQSTTDMLKYFFKETVLLQPQAGPDHDFFRGYQNNFIVFPDSVLYAGVLLLFSALLLHTLLQSR